MMFVLNYIQCKYYESQLHSSLEWCIYYIEAYNKSFDFYH